MAVSAPLLLLLLPGGLHFIPGECSGRNLPTARSIHFSRVESTYVSQLKSLFH